MHNLQQLRQQAVTPGGSRDPGGAAVRRRRIVTTLVALASAASLLSACATDPETQARMQRLGHALEQIGQSAPRNPPPRLQFCQTRLVGAYLNTWCF
jgi:hypothetical protein